MSKKQIALKKEEAKLVLAVLGIPKRQQNEMSCLTFLALCKLKPNEKWTNISPESMSVMGRGRKNSAYPGIMRFISDIYGKQYAENTRESIRRQVLHTFQNHGLIVRNPEEPDLPTNSSRTHYRLVSELIPILRAFKTHNWEANVRHWHRVSEALHKKHIQESNKHRVPLVLPTGKRLDLSPGAHNELQRDIVELFKPFFAKESQLIYLGDTSKKDLFIREDILNSLGVKIAHDKLPDIVLYDDKRCWIFLIEAVTSHGPISVKRFLQLKEMFDSCKEGLIFVSAFKTVSDFKKYADDIAWETEVWISELPQHLIHFNGDRFLGPR